MANIKPGYMGYAKVGTDIVRFQDSSIVAKQDVLIPDLMAGSYNRMVYGYGPVSVDGSLSGPMTENFVDYNKTLWNWAVERNDCGQMENTEDVTIYYYCAGEEGGVASARTYNNLQVNSFTFSVAAGDIAQYSLDVIGTGVDDWDTDTYAGHKEDVNAPGGQEAEKLITWDTVKLTLDTEGGGQKMNATNIVYSNFEMTVANNIEVAYAITDDDSDSNYFPYDLVTGIRSITGSFSAYGIPDNINGAFDYDSLTNDSGARTGIELSIADKTFKIFARLHRVEPASSVGPVISTIAFTGIGSQNLTL